MEWDQLHNIANQKHQQSQQAGTSSSHWYRPNRSSPIVAMNEAATFLRDVGTEKAEALQVLDKKIRTVQKQESRQPKRASPRETEERINFKNKRENQPRDKKKSQVTQQVLALPAHQLRRHTCMKCAGFIKANHTGELFGTRYTKIIGWDAPDIVAFYSRVMDAFGIPFYGRKGSQARYLFLKDSLALTLASKFKLKSRRKAYKQFGKSLGGFPVENHQRPRRLQNDQPIPFKITCVNRSKAACRLLPEDDSETSNLRGKQQEKKE